MRPPMSSDFSPELRRELLDDFYAECDELLTAMRDALTQLEIAPKDSAQEKKLIEGLFRSTHSFKGNSSIVGLRSAEELAHGMEDLLRAISKNQVSVSENLVDGLLAGVQRLEKIVVGQRLEKPLPKTGDLLARFRKFIPEQEAAGAAPAAIVTDDIPASPAEDPVAIARAKGLKIFTATFSPSASLDQRGVNVTAVRQRLSAIGEILGANPVVRGKGAITFEFVLGLTEVPADLASWANDEVIFRAAPSDETSVEVLSDSSSSPDAGFAETLSLTPSHIVRVDLARLDELMRITGEMVIHRSRLEDRVQQLGDSHSGLKEVNLALSRSLREMREAITRVRMVPIAELFTRMPFVVRDLMRGSDKKARVVLLGNQTEVDKFLVERLKEPLLHLVRNAFSHGIESTAARASAGKSAEATITLQAKSVGEFVIIQVRDDGRGIDSQAIAARATGLGLSVPASLGSDSLLEILCTPGFSTREHADLASGRGVGMAVVANTIRELGGSLTLESTLGQGSEFTLKLPLSLSIANAIIVGVGAHICAVPQNSVDEIIQVSADEIRTINRSEVTPYRDGLLPLLRLQAMFGVSPVKSAQLTLLVVSSERGAVGLVVDRVRSQREIVIRPLADPLLRVPGISGATELGDGRPILILDPNALTQGVTRPPKTASLDSTMSKARAS
jgi:two-component system chemotaxis sensor kinase CheA